LNHKLTHPPINTIDEDALRQLQNATRGGPVLILTHDNPDPDALASGKALATLLDYKWGISSSLKFNGLIARAENKAMLKILVPEWQKEDNLTHLEDYAAIALVDTQPGAGNNSLPDNLHPQIVIDHHHPVREGLDKVLYVDMRPEVGATVSLLFQHLEAAGITPDPTLATAMFYGIQTDTQGLSRGTAPLDQYVYFKLLSLLDRDKLIQVERAGLSRDYFRAFNKGLQNARIYGHVVIANLGKIHRPDFVAEMADLLIRLNEAQASLCLGYHQTTLYFSLRTEPSGLDAGFLVQKIIFPPGKAGGHGTMAGGQIDLEGKDYNQVCNALIARFLNTMNDKGEGKPLLNDDSGRNDGK
jgi:nanoRNase/pAp phosphatase (c-di-AMP/oligoRNAs hydrolase)